MPSSAGPKLAPFGHIALDDFDSRDFFEPSRLCPIPHQDPDGHSLAHEFVGYE